MDSETDGLIALHSGTRPIRTLLAFRYPAMTSLLVEVLSKHDDIEIVGEVWDPASTLTLLRVATADVAVLDAMLLPIGREDVVRLSLASIGAVVVTTRCLKSTELDFPIVGAFRTFAHVAMCEPSARFVEAIRWVADEEPRRDMGRLRRRTARTCVLHSSSDLRGLTMSELRVLGLIARGHSSRTISEALEVSSRTVENHRYHLMKKLQARNVAELLLHAVEAGLVDV